MKFIEFKIVTTDSFYSSPIAQNVIAQFLRLLALTCFLGNAPTLKASSDPTAAPVEKYIISPELVGVATLKVMLWNIFDAELYATGGDFDPEKPFALALDYRRNFSSQSIVEESIKQIESQQMASDSAIAIWRSQLESVIPDVESGMTITGIRTRDGHTVFYTDDELSGRVTDQEFTRLFFNIWLGENSSRPELRRKLLRSTQS